MSAELHAFNIIVAAPLSVSVGTSLSNTVIFELHLIAASDTKLYVTFEIPP